MGVIGLTVRDEMYLQLDYKTKYNSPHRSPLSIYAVLHTLCDDLTAVSFSVPGLCPELTAGV